MIADVVSLLGSTAVGSHVAQASLTLHVCHNCLEVVASLVKLKANNVFNLAFET